MEEEKLKEKDRLILEALVLLLERGIYNNKRNNLCMEINDFLVESEEKSLELNI